MEGGGRFNPPPPPSTPRAAPWTDAEQIHRDLEQIAGLLQALLSQSTGVSVNETGSSVDLTGLVPSDGGGAGGAGGTGGAGGAGAASQVHERLFGATGGSAASIQVRNANWETNMWQGWELEIVEGSGSGQFRRIIVNTRDTITPRKNFDVDPDGTSVFILRPRYPMDNPNDFRTITKDVALTTAPEQLTSPADALTVPNGWPVLLLACPDNSGNVYIAYSSAAALAAATRFYYLEAGKSIALYPTKTDQIWIAVATDGDGVTAYVPQWTTDET